MSRNLLINSAFDVWQRGTSFASGARAFGADHWTHRRGLNAAGATFSRQTGFAGAKYCMRMQRDSGNAAVDAVGIGQQVESQIVRRLAGKYIRVSLDVLAGALFSGTSLSTLQVSTGTAENETFGTSTFATGDASQFPSWVNPTISAVEGKRVYSPVVLLAEDALSLWIGISWIPAGVAGATDYLDVTNVQLEDVGLKGPATPYEAAPLSVTGGACRHFYQAKTVRSENGSRHIPFVPRMFKAPTVGVSVGSAANITADGFELTHAAAADCVVTANAEI